jgi:hypothetical protein
MHKGVFVQVWMMVMVVRVAAKRWRAAPNSVVVVVVVLVEIAAAKLGERQQRLVW